MSRPPAQPPRRISGWMLVLGGLALLGVWALILLLVAALGLPLSDRRQSGGFLLLLLPLAAVAPVAIGFVSIIRRKPITFTSGNSGRYGSMGPRIRAEERRQRDERKKRRRLAAEQKAARTGRRSPER